MGATDEFRHLVEVCEGEDLSAFVESSSASENMIRLVVSLSTYGNEHVGRWEITAANPVASLIPVGEDPLLDYYDRDHPLLLPYVAERARISFTGRPAVPVRQVIGALYAAHAAIVGDYLPLGQYMNTGYGREPQVPFKEAPAGYGTLTDLLEGGYGTLADGPLPLIQAYAAVLLGHGLRVSVSEASPPARGAWHDDWSFGWDPIGIVSLLLFRRSTDQSGAHEDPGYVIAREFTATLV